VTTFTPSSKQHPCPVCVRTKDGDCRLRDDGWVHCHTHRGDGLKPGAAAPSGAPFKFVSTSDAAQGFGIWKPADQWEERSNSTTNPRSHREPRSVAGVITLTAKLARPKGPKTFSFTRWDGTPVKAVKHRIDHGDGRGKEVTWRPALSKEGLTQADLAPWNWHDAIVAHQQNDSPIVVVKGELKARWLKALEIPAVSINEWNHTTAKHLLALGDAVVLAPDCDLADLQGWYAKAKAALPQARHLLAPGANWLDPPEKEGVGVDDWLQTNLESVTPNTASDLLAAITGQPWQPQGDDQEPESRLTYSELLAAALEAIRRSDRDAEMELRAELSIRFRRDHQQIDAALFRLLTQQSIGETATTCPLQVGLDLEQIDGMDSLLDGFLVANDQALIYGKAGSGKTLACLAAGFAVIDGTGFLDHDSSPPKGRVLFIASDSGAPPLKAALCDLGLAEHPAVSRGPGQGFFVWAHDHGQGMPAWTASISDWVRLLDFVTARKIDLVFIDSAKAVCSQADPVVSYASNEAVSAMLTFVKSVICPHTSVVWISHDGTEKGAHAGAKAWAEIPSIVHRIEQVPDRPSERSWTVVKNRMGSTRSFNYTLTPDGQLQACQGVAVIRNAKDAVLRVLTEAYQRGNPTVSRDGLVDEIGRRWSYAQKTVDNTLSRLARMTRPPICRVGTPVGHYKLSPRMTEELSRQASQPTAISTPLEGSTQTGKVQDKKPVIERDLVSSRPFPAGNPERTEPLPTSPQGKNHGNSLDPSQGLTSEVVPSQRESHRACAREEEFVPSPSADVSPAYEPPAVTSPAHLAANAARSNLTDFQPCDQVYIAHQRLAPGRLHPAVVTKVINAEIHFDPPLEGLLRDPEDLSAGPLLPPQPISKTSSSKCLPELGGHVGVRIEEIQRDGETWRRLVWPLVDGSEVVREMPPVRSRWDEAGLEEFLQEIEVA